MDPFHVVIDYSIDDAFKVIEAEEQSEILLGVYQGIKDLTELNSLCEKNDFAAILNDEQLFWLLFCREYIDTNTYDKFGVKKTDAQVNISFTKDCYQDEAFKLLTRNIDIIRLALKEAMADRRSFELAFVARNIGDFSGYGSFIPAQAEYNIPYGPFNAELQSYYCQAWILPTLPFLTKVLGITCTCSKKLVTKIEHNKYGGKIVKTEEVDHVKFVWSKDLYLVYPIQPKKVEELDFPAMIERCYKDRKFCEFKLQSASGSLLPVHGMILQMVGGEFFQKMLASQMAESNSRTIQLDCSHEIAAIFLEFIYLGANKALEMLETSGNLGAILFEIFTFANQYQIQNLIDASANWITLFTDAEHLESLEALAKLYDNKHLQNYCAFLQPPKLDEMYHKV